LQLKALITRYKLWQENSQSLKISIVYTNKLQKYFYFLGWGVERGGMGGNY